eukprot:XP_011664809.1 PREDICTED: cation-dependent mannose-6-phosphate receptor-like [Strongylocentrotus purpuratus]
MMSLHGGDCFILLCLVVVVWIQDVESQQCTSLIGATNKCACQYSDGSTGTTKSFDFTPLGNANGQAAFAYKRATDGYDYAYNPCFPFSDASCQNTAACQVSADGKYTFPIGDPITVAYSVENSDIVLTYGPFGTGSRKAIVNFHCDASALTEATYTPLGDKPDVNTYKFTIGTCLACLTDVPNCHGSGGGGGGGLTGGGILCIIFTVLLVVYIVGGVLFQKFGRGATGKELFPNYAFWSDFPIFV